MICLTSIGYAVDADFLCHEAQTQHAALVTIDVIFLLEGEALRLLEEDLLRVRLALVGLRGQLDEQTAAERRPADEPLVHLHVLTARGDDCHLHIITILVSARAILVVQPVGAAFEIRQQILFRISVKAVIANL